MLLQGDLQKVFDALYHLGVIDPVLEKDWSQEFEAIEKNPYQLAEIIGVVNSTMGDYQDLMNKLGDFTQDDLGHLAIMVAKELVGFHTNKVVH
ncbi:MAG: cytochrome [Bdellovibrionales bacterium]|nr:cytochrome [Bdellovibrionales bacterium]